MDDAASPALLASDGRGHAVVDELRERLRAAIISGEIPASSPRTQAELAGYFNVGRTPLREALRMLELEHLIIREPNRRFRAADLSVAEIEELGILRVTLEAAAVRMTVPSLSDAEYAVLEGLYAESRRLALVGEWDDYELAHHRFHMLLTRNVGVMHAEQLTRLWEQAARYRRAFEHLADADGRDETSQREHRAILDAAEAGDADESARLLAEHHARAAREIGARVDPGYAMDRLRMAVEIARGDVAFDLT